MKIMITEVVCGIWIRSLTSLWMKRQEGSEICTEKKYDASLQLGFTVFLFLLLNLCFVITVTIEGENAIH